MGSKLELEPPDEARDVRVTVPELAGDRVVKGFRAIGRHTKRDDAQEDRGRTDEHVGNHVRGVKSKQGSPHGAPACGRARVRYSASKRSRQLRPSTNTYVSSSRTMQSAY